MKKDFYDVLSIKRNASDEQISTAFKKLALRHHPLKNPAEMNINLQKFHEICEAYEVLSNLQFKTIYDQFGEDILRQGVKDENGTYQGGYVYQQNCYEIFDTYFLKYNPFFDIYDGKGHQLHGSLFGSAFGGANQPEPPRHSDVFVEIPCTLFEFYNGSIKVAKYERKELALDGHTIKTVQIQKSIQVRPGYSQANNLTFKGEGHLMKNYSTNLIVSFTEQNDSLKSNPQQHQLVQHYKRSGSNLIYTAKISLQQAINSEPVHIKTFDGRLLAVPVDQIVGPKTVIRLSGEGMPIYVDRKQDNTSNCIDRGDLFEHELHQSRLRSIRSMLDTKAPKQFNHLQGGTNAKTKQLMSKYIEVQNENRVLLKKMLSIDMKPSILNPQKIVLQQAPSSQSLNRISRLKELIRVNQENKELLRRLQTASSTYDKSRWDNDFNHNLYFMDMIRKNSSRYIKHPYFLSTPNGQGMMFGSQSQQEFYTSVNSGRTASAQPGSRVKLTQSASGFRKDPFSRQQQMNDGELNEGAQTLQPIMEGNVHPGQLEQIHKQRESLNSRQSKNRPRLINSGSALNMNQQLDSRPMTAPNMINQQSRGMKSQRKIIIAQGSNNKNHNINEKKNRSIINGAVSHNVKANEFETKSMSGVEPSEGQIANNSHMQDAISESQNRQNQQINQEEEQPINEQALQMQQQLQNRPDTRAGN
eukprot:403369378